jgi:hypothetical protein
VQLALHARKCIRHRDAIFFTRSDDRETPLAQGFQP